MTDPETAEIALHGFVKGIPVTEQNRRGKSTRFVRGMCENHGGKSLADLAKQGGQRKIRLRSTVHKSGILCLKHDPLREIVRPSVEGRAVLTQRTQYNGPVCDIPFGKRGLIGIQPDFRVLRQDVGFHHLGNVSGGIGKAVFALRDPQNSRVFGAGEGIELLCMQVGCG